MKKILVTTDLSKISESGIKFAIALAKQMKARLTFYYVSQVTKPTSWSNAKYAIYRKENITLNTVKLKNFIKKASGSDWSKISLSGFHVGLSLDSGRKIVSFAETEGVDYICMSTNGAGGLTKFIGTTTTYVLANTQIPLIVVPPKHKPFKLGHILFACDLVSMKRELKIVINFVQNIKGKLAVYHYISPAEMNKRKRNNALNVLETKNQVFKFKELNSKFSFSEQLQKDINKIKPTLTILFKRRKRSWIKSLIDPSKSEKMAQIAKSPLLIFSK